VLQGPVTAALLRPDLTAGGLFRADFLVVTAAGYPTNTLRGVQRQRWSSGLIAGTLDIGCGPAQYEHSNRWSCKAL